MTDKILCAILYLFINNTNIYNKYINILNISSFKEKKLIHRLFLSLEKLKKDYPKDSHSLDELVLLFNTDYPVLSKDDQTLLPVLMAELSTVTVSTDEDLVIGYLQSLHERSLGEKLAIAALDFSQGRIDKEKLGEVSKELFTNFVKPDEQLYTECNLDAAFAHVGSPGFRWRLRALNQAIGSLRKGNFGFLFARPETGKTTFLASEVTFYASQTDRPILWVNNEEAKEQIMLRCYCAALGKSKDWIFANLDEAKKEFQELVGDRLKIVDTTNANKKDVERICKELNPALIVFDQLDKIVGAFGDERNDLVLKAKYQWARELSKLYGPVIGVCQAGGTAENKRYLSMNDVDSSHTAKQGEADWVLGIGMTNSDNDEFVRYLSICKNKLPGDEDSIPEMRHGKMQVAINPFIARYEG